MHVLAVPGGNDTSALLRLMWPAKTLSQHHDVVGAGLEWRLTAGLDDDGHVRTVDPPDCDVVVFQRIQSRAMAEAIPLLQDAGIAVVVDIDDDLSAVHPANSAWDAVHPGSSPEANWRHLATACRHADLVTVTTPALARVYAPHGRVTVLPNRLPEVVSLIDHEDQTPLRIGWPGRVDTHPNDLQVTRGAVARVLAATDSRFVNIGQGGAAKALGIDGDELSTGLVPIERWHVTIATNVDVGVVPLADTRFNRAKSGLKLLELSALGIPTVASPTPDNLRLHRLGMGVLATKPRQWEAELRRLLTDSDWRLEVGQSARVAASRETLEGHAEDWWDAWTSAADHHRDRRAA